MMLFQAEPELTEQQALHRMAFLIYLWIEVLLALAGLFAVYNIIWLLLLNSIVTSNAVTRIMVMVMEREPTLPKVVSVSGIVIMPVIVALIYWSAL